MPYRKTYRRRTYRKRRPYVGRRTQRIRSLAGQKPVTSIERLAGYAGTVGRVARTVSIMAGMINSEKKFLDTTLSGVIENTGTYQTRLSQIAQGDDSSQRNGRSILLDSLDIKWAVNANSLNTNVQYISWAIVLDKKPDELDSCNWVRVMDTNTNFSHIDRVNYQGRFVILARGMFTLRYPEKAAQMFKKFIRLKGIHIKYDGTSATEIDQNELNFIAYSNQTVNLPTITGEARLSYYDN